MSGANDSDSINANASMRNNANASMRGSGRASSAARGLHGGGGGMSDISRADSSRSLYAGHCVLKCIFYADFHPEAGIRMVHQSPLGYIDKPLFDSVHSYIITKPQLHGKLVSVCAGGLRFLGCPSCIDSQRYARNALMYNVVLVFDEEDDATRYECITRKLATYLMALEQDCGYLSEASSGGAVSGSGAVATGAPDGGGAADVDMNNDRTMTQPTAPALGMSDLLHQIRHQLNATGLCSIRVNHATLVHLQVIELRADPDKVEAHHVPILTHDAYTILDAPPAQRWCPASKQLLPYIDGQQTVMAIAAKADMEPSIVTTCLQNLLYYGVIKLISAFQYSNVYTTTPLVHTLLSDNDLRQRCLSYVACSQHKTPCIQDVLTLYCNMLPGTTVKALCIRYNPHKMGIDERKLLQFGVLNGLIRRMHRYPVRIQPRAPRHFSAAYATVPSGFLAMLDGRHSYDEICCRFGLSASELEERVDCDPSILVFWK